VSVFSRLAAVWRLCSRKSAADRSIEQTVKLVQPRRILAIGLGDGQRCRRVIALAQRYRAAQEVHFTGIDRFEDRPSDRAPFPLKEAYRQFRATGARVRLAPGDPYGALVRAANSISGIDLVLISEEVNRASLDAAWFYLPRTLSKDAVVLWADGTLAEGEYRRVPRLELLQAARPLRTARRRAA